MSGAEGDRGERGIGSAPLARRQESRTLNIKRGFSEEHGGGGGGGGGGGVRWPRSCINEKIQETDAVFFDTFQNVIHQKEAFLDEPISSDINAKSADKPLPPAVGTHTAAAAAAAGGLSNGQGQLVAAQVEQLYIEALYTIIHKIGTTSNVHLSENKDLYEYIRQAFGVSPPDDIRLRAKADEEKPPIVILDITVLEAKDLEAKDADGFSDPYCMLGIVPASACEATNGTKPTAVNTVTHVSAAGAGSTAGSVASGGHCLTPTRTSSQKRKTPLELIPARFIKTTSVKNNTLNPIWNEKFRLDIDDVSSDRLHMDIWDHDDESSVADSAKRLNEVKGLKGLGRYFKQIAQSARTSSHENQDDFLGTIDVALVDIPSTGLDQWYDLHGRSARSNVQGQVRLRLNLATREDRGRNEEEEGLFETREHRDLISVFLEHEYKTAKELCENWTGELSKAAKTILHQHAIQGDITEAQQAVCLWMAFVRLFCKKPFDWSLLINCIAALEQKWQADSLYREEEEALGNSFDQIIAYCMNMILHQNELLNLDTVESKDRLTSMLTCLSKIYSSKIFCRCCPFKKDLKFEISDTLKKMAAERYNRLQARRRSETFTEDGLISGFTLMMNKLNTDCHRALHIYSPVYASVVDVDYFPCIYKQTHRMLSADLVNDLSGLTQVSSEVVLETLDLEIEAKCAAPVVKIYLSLAHFDKLAKHLASSDRSRIGVMEFDKVFTSYIDRWINLVKCVMTSRVTTAVQLDQIELIDGDTKQSSSAIDVPYTFRQVADFWLRFRWADVADPLRGTAAITEVICDGAVLYTDIMHNKLKAASYYDEVGQFDVTKQLCYTINDMEQVRRALQPLPSILKFDSLNAGASSGDKTSTSAGCDITSRSHGLYEYLRKADDVIATKIKQVADRVADRMRPDIKRFVFHLCWAPEKAQSEDVIGELMNYLDSNLLTLNDNLLHSNFDRILSSIWIELLEEIADIISSRDQEFRTATWISGRLMASLATLVDFFHAGGIGLKMVAIQCPLYINVHRQLEFNQLSTNELMERFYVDKLQQQENTTGSKFGLVYVRVYYNRDAHLLKIDVDSAKNLIPLDTNGLSDPYVIVRLAPEHVFQSEQPVQTRVISKSLNPQFRDTFEYNITEEQCLGKGACVVFTVMDHDVLSANDFAGEAYLSLRTIQGISTRKPTGLTALTPVGLPLLHPKLGEGAVCSTVLSALSIRDEQRTVAEFIKKRKNLITVDAD